MKKKERRVKALGKGKKCGRKGKRKMMMKEKKGKERKGKGEKREKGKEKKGKGKEGVSREREKKIKRGKSQWVGKGKKEFPWVWDPCPLERQLVKKIELVGDSQ